MSLFLLFTVRCITQKHWIYAEENWFSSKMGCVKHCPNSETPWKSSREASWGHVGGKINRSLYWYHWEKHWWYWYLAQSCCLWLFEQTFFNKDLALYITYCIYECIKKKAKNDEWTRKKNKIDLGKFKICDPKKLKSYIFTYFFI